MSESELIENLKRNNKEAFRLLFDTYHKKVFSTAMGFLHNSDDANDLTQEVFIKIFDSIGKFKAESKLSTWIFRIAVNLSLNYIRDNKKHSLLQRIEKFFNSSKMNESANLKKEEINPEIMIQNSQNAELVHQAIEALPEKQRIAFTLNKYDDLSYQEIAEIMNTSLSSVESLIHRAKDNLQKKLFSFYKNFQ